MGRTDGVGGVRAPSSITLSTGPGMHRRVRRRARRRCGGGGDLRAQVTSHAMRMGGQVARLSASGAALRSAWRSTVFGFDTVPARSVPRRSHPSLGSLSS